MKQNRNEIAVSISSGALHEQLCFCGSFVKNYPILFTTIFWSCFDQNSFHKRKKVDRRWMQYLEWIIYVSVSILCKAVNNVIGLHTNGFIDTNSRFSDK